MDYFWTRFNRSTGCSISSTTPSSTCSNIIIDNYTHAWAATTTHTSSSTLHGGESFGPGPHPMCLKLGKRNHKYLAEGRNGASSSSIYNNNKKGKTAAAAARCQVDGCAVLLVQAKEYHRRHKVCEMHAKASQAFVFGIQQRFCQQCSRFHAVGEFDESKRSCRRRLAGHNERRRKGSPFYQDNSLPRKRFYQEGIGAARQPVVIDTGEGSECALSLLSSPNTGDWNFNLSGDLPAKSSAALRELIAENRASALAACSSMQQPSYHEDVMNNYYKLHGPSPHYGGGHLSLDLMQPNPNSAFGLLPVNDYHVPTILSRGGRNGFILEGYNSHYTRN